MFKTPTPEQQRSKFWLGLTLIVAVVIWFMVFTLPKREFKVCFLDVGQGDAIFIQMPGGRQILVDGGPDHSVLRELSKQMPFWDRSLDLVFVSHLHADHVRGLIGVLERYKVDKFFVNKGNYESSVVTELYRSVDNEKQLQLKPFMAGDRIEVGELVIQSLWPEKDQIAGVDDINLSSMVLMFEYSDKLKFLLTGDAELDNEWTADLIPTLTRVDVLKLPHQGNAKSVNEQVLDILNPAVAVITVGENNFGHPSSKTLHLLNGENIQSYRTDKNGTICVTVNKDLDNYSVTSKYK